MVGIGPGGQLDRTHRAEQAILQSDVIVGYGPYLDAVADLTEGKECFSTPMTHEMERCRWALNQAQGGRVVSLVSSGDPGIYGMAGLVMELSQAEKNRITIEVVPGVTAASAAAARLGAPLMLDFACISLSDLLVPWEVIRTRLEAVASADLVTVLYNPRSKKRISQLEEAATIFRQHRLPATPVGVATAIGTKEEIVTLSNLEQFLDLEIAMKSVVIIGNRSSLRLQDWFITPRGYRV